jgi:hypothetical protein
MIRNCLAASLDVVAVLLPILFVEETNMTQSTLRWRFSIKMCIASASTLLLMLLLCVDSHAAGDWETMTSFHRPFRDTKVAEWGKDWNVKDENGKPLICWFDAPWWDSMGSLYESHIIYRGKNPVAFDELLVNGETISSLVYPKGNILWYRLTPRKLQPDQIATLLIQFRENPNTPTKIEITTKDDSAYQHMVDFAKLDSQELINRVAMSKNLKTIHAWIEIRKDDFALQRVLFDGVDFTQWVTLEKPYGNVIPISLSLPGALVSGSEHHFFVEHSGGTCAISFRAYPSQFHFAIYEGPGSKNLKWHNFDISWHHRRPGVKEMIERWQEGIQVIAPCHGASTQYRNVPNVFADYLPDEPDIKDAVAHKEIKWVGQRLGLEAPNMNSIAERQSTSDQNTVNLIVVGKSNRPANFFAYGRIADLLATDYYCISSELQPLTCYVSARVTRIAGEPLASWSVIGCFSRLESQWKRFPTGQEMRYMALCSVAGGAQSLAYWMYPNGTKTKGPASNPELWRAMGRINGELKTAAHLLAKSYPVDSSIVNAPDSVITQVLRTVDDEATMLVLLNKNCRSHAAGMEIDRMKDFEIGLLLPPGTKAVSLCKLSMDGPVEIGDLKTSKENTTFQVKNLEEGDIYVVAHSREALARIRNIYRTNVQPNNQRASQLLSQ